MKFNKINKKHPTKTGKPNGRPTIQKSNKLQNFNKKKSKQKPFTAKPKQIDREDDEIKLIQSKYATIDSTAITSFGDFPLSQKTRKGLAACGYHTPTTIQKEAIGYALQGKDVLGAAITGSGKTLAFLIPVLEHLYRKKWSRPDGVGAIIITPTRELAYQIFETLKKVGFAHDFSAGLIIGGKNLKFEKSRMDQCNIVICTPGRLLHHMDQNYVFNCSTMEILVLDEADRCLDLGFQDAMNAIIEHLPPQRQTFLYSATQTKSVKDLARLSLQEPVYVAPHEQAAYSTPDALAQNYVVVNLEEKLTMLYSFYKTHSKQKCIVFLNSCKQVKYIYEIFRKILPPRSNLLGLYGTLHQDRRMAIYDEFCRKSNVFLFATDVASRGLDFPAVNWVVQLDCPEDVNTYIHRAGRTARNAAHGENLLVLMPSEELAMVDELKERKIPINKISIDPKRLFSPHIKIEAILAKNQELKETAQRAFVAYIKSVVLMKNKKIFNVNGLNTDAFALSLGLVVVPRVRFLQRMKKHQEQNRIKQLKENGKYNKEDDEENSNAEDSNNIDTDDEEVSHKLAPTKTTTTTTTPSKFIRDKLDFNVSSDDDDDETGNGGGGGNSFIKIKRRDHEITEDQLPEVPPLELEKSRNKKVLTKAALAKRVIKKKLMTNTKVIFDDDGVEQIDTAKQLQSDLAKEYNENRNGDGGIDIETAKNLLREEDKFDKERFKQMVKAKHKLAKTKGKQPGEQEEFDEFGSDDESTGPDMSWLPDPDKIYGKQENESNEDESNDDDDDDDDSNDEEVDDEDDDDNEDEDDDDAQTSSKKQSWHRQVVNSSDESESDSDDNGPIHKPKQLVTKQNGKLKRDHKRNQHFNDNDEENDDHSAPQYKKSKKLTSKLSVNEAEMLAMKLLAG